MALFLIVLYLIGITPLRLTAFFVHPGERPNRICLRAWGVRLPKIGKGRFSARGLRPGAILPVLRAAAGHIAVRRLELCVRVGGDAARAALITAFLRSLGPAFPRAQISCVPAFGEKGSLRAGCILDARLGILLAAALAGRFAQSARRKKEAAA